MGKGRSYMNSYADSYMRGKVVKEVGALLDNILVEEITTPTIIKLEFGPSYDTIRKLRQQDTSIYFETIRQFCYVIGYYLYQEIEAVENYNLKSATYRVSWEFTCKTTKILLLYIFLGHNRNVVNTKFPYPIKRLEVIRRFNQKSIAFNQSLS